MERRTITMHSYVMGRKSLPENTIVLKRSINSLRQSNRTGHALELTLPKTILESVNSSSLNIARKIWNALPPEVVALEHPGLFKQAVRSSTTYANLVSRSLIRSVEADI
uniref:Transposase n=1 Tax=Acrobeloides nanus TaxID=290746 RepID=A0A914DLW4_9BILA